LKTTFLWRCSIYFDLDWDILTTGIGLGRATSHI